MPRCRMLDALHIAVILLTALTLGGCGGRNGSTPAQFAAERVKPGMLEFAPPSELLRSAPCSITPLR